MSESQYLDGEDLSRDIGTSVNHLWSDTVCMAINPQLESASNVAEHRILFNLHFHSICEINHQ